MSEPIDKTHVAAIVTGLYDAAKKVNESARLVDLVIGDKDPEAHVLVPYWSWVEFERLVGLLPS